LILLVQMRTPMHQSISHKRKLRASSVLERKPKPKKTLKRTNIKLTKLGDPGKADLIATGSEAIYGPVSFEAVDPAHADTKLVVTIFAYRGAAGNGP
jgi:hypothetical protein